MNATESELKTALHFELDKPALHEALNATDLALASRGAGKVGADGAHICNKPPLRQHLLRHTHVPSQRATVGRHFPSRWSIITMPIGSCMSD